MPETENRLSSKALEIEKLTTEIAGDRISYFRAGAGPPLLLLHGGPGGEGGVRKPWRLLQSSLTRNRDIVIFDLRGAGLSEPQLCAGFVENTPPIFNRRSRQEREQGYNDAVRACVASLKAQGIEP